MNGEWESENPERRMVGRGGKFRAGLLVCLLAAAVIQADSQPLAKGLTKFLGCSISTIRPDFPTYWNQVTPENDGKWGSVEGTEGSYNWGPLDDIYNYAINNYFRYRHHNLVWGQQQPSWITSVDSATQRAAVEEWIQMVGARYPSTSFVDVVNEPFHAPPPYMNAIGGAGATGWDWVIQSFTWAREYFLLGVKLALNDYNILQSNTATDNYLRLIDTLRVRHLIDAIGIQGHYFEFKGSGYTYPLSTLQYNLDRLAATGLPVYITEFDINEPNDSIQLASYKTYFPLFWEDPGVKGMTLWGYVQGEIWQTNAYLLRSDGSERPALEWLRRYLASPMKPVLVSPLGSSGEPRNATLVWLSSASATAYTIQVATDSIFSAPVVDTTVADTMVRVTPLAANTTFFWRVMATNDSGPSSYSLVGRFTTGDQTVSVREVALAPAGFALSQSYPNPCNPTSQIRYSIPEAGYASLKVYNLLGEQVGTLVDGFRLAGSYSVTFDGRRLSSGIYFYTMKSGRYEGTKRLVLLK